MARKNQQLSSEQLRQRVIEVVTQAVQAYWELDYAWNNLNVQTEAVKLAERQYESNRRQAEQGILAPIDVVAAQTQVATFQQSLFPAQQALTAAENNLKSLMLPNRSDLMWGAALIPETPLDTSAPIPPLEDAVKAGARRAPGNGRDRTGHRYQRAERPPRPRGRQARASTRLPICTPPAWPAPPCPGRIPSWRPSSRAR